MIPSTLPPRPSEQLLVDWLTTHPLASPARGLLCTSLGRAQFAAAAAQRWPDTRIDCNYLDLYQSQVAAESECFPNLHIGCEADFPAPDSGYDLAVLPFTAHGDAELTRDLLQSACQRLADGGILWTSTDNPNDRWLRAELDKLFRRVKAHPREGGVVYSAAHLSPPAKIKDFSCWFAYRDSGRLLRAFTRPGVFSHRRLDTGARCLLETMHIEPGMRILDIGCGAGTVSFAAAARAADTRVTAIDSNPRAVACTRLGAAANELPQVTAMLRADAQVDEPSTYDVVLANPPYYSHQRIAALFVEGARAALRSGGQLLVVTKDPEWYVECLPRWFTALEVVAIRAYFVVRATRSAR